MEEQRPGAVAEDAWEANKHCLMHKKGKESRRFPAMQRTSSKKAVPCLESSGRKKRKSLAGCCLHASDPSVEKTSRLLTSTFSQQTVCIKSKQPCRQLNSSCVRTSPRSVYTAGVSHGCFWPGKTLISPTSCQGLKKNCSLPDSP